MSKCQTEQCNVCQLIEFCGGCAGSNCLFKNCDAFSCQRCPGFCWQHKVSKTFMAKDFEYLPIVKKSLPNFILKSHFIPTVWPFKEITFRQREAYIMNFSRIFNPSTKNISSFDPKDLIGLNKSSKLIVSFYCKDACLENFWRSLQDIKLQNQLAKLKCDALISPNFSNYFETPRFGHFMNIKRNIEALKILSDTHECILDINSCETESHQYIYSWIKSQMISGYRFNIISFNFQTIKLLRHKEYAIEKLSFFHKKLPMEVNFLITGLSGEKEAPDMHETCPGRHLIFTSSGAFMKGTIKASIESPYKTTDKTKSEQFELNCRLMERLHKKYSYGNKNLVEADSKIS